MALIISNKILEKLASKHGVNQDEVEQCFANRNGRFLQDTRETHLTDPLTNWFIAETDYGRKLKIAFVLLNDNVYIRTAFPPNETELRIYKIHGEGS